MSNAHLSFPRVKVFHNLMVLDFLKKFIGGSVEKILAHCQIMRSCKTLKHPEFEKGLCLCMFIVHAKLFCVLQK